MSSVITVRIPRELKENLSKYGVEVSKVTRKALEEEIERRKLEELKKIAAELREVFSKISDEEIIEGIREARRLG